MALPVTDHVDATFYAELKEKGVEVVKADFNDVKSLEEAFKGAHGVFALTNCMSSRLHNSPSLSFYKQIDWDPSVFNEEKEFVQGKLLVDAAKKAGVKHFRLPRMFLRSLSCLNDPFIIRRISSLGR